MLVEFDCIARRLQHHPRLRRNLSTARCILAASRITCALHLFVLSCRRSLHRCGGAAVHCNLRQCDQRLAYLDERRFDLPLQQPLQL